MTGSLALTCAAGRYLPVEREARPWNEGRQHPSTSRAAGEAPFEIRDLGFDLLGALLGRGGALRLGGGSEEGAPNSVVPV